MTEADELELAEAVAEGAAFMDAIDKGLTEAERWYWVVDPAKLDLRVAVRNPDTECGCVMAQHSPDGVFDPSGDYGLRWDEPSTLGFDALSVGAAAYAEYPALTDLWVEQINDRRAAYFDRHPEAVLA